MVRPAPPPFEIAPSFMFPPKKDPKIWFSPSFKEKNTMNDIAHETTKVNMPNLLRG